METKYRLMLARFPGSGSERMECVDWIAAVSSWAQRIGVELAHWRMADTPITMSRNRCIKEALERGIDFLVMVDSDMGPDIDPAHPFLPNAVEFALSRYHEAPTIIAAPYLTGAPDHLPCIGRWRSDSDGMTCRADTYNREEAAALHGTQPADFLGTGLMLIDMRVFSGFKVGGEAVKLPPPWFEYEWTDEYHTHKATTEDMYFTRNVSLLFAEHGLRVNFCDWDAWAYHFKTERVGGPVDTTVLDIVRLFNRG